MEYEWIVGISGIPDDSTGSLIIFTFEILQRIRPARYEAFQTYKCAISQQLNIALTSIAATVTCTLLKKS